MLTVDIWHNVLWSRYKAVVYSETWRLGRQLNFDIRFFQIAETDGTRAALSPVDHSAHRYPFVLLFKSSLDEIAPLRLMLRLLRHVMRTSSQLVCLVDHGHAAYWAQLLALKLRGKKVAVFCDATLHDHAEVAWKALCKRIVFRLLDGAFCYGARSRDYLIKYGMPVDRIYVRRQAAALPPDYDAAQIPGLRLLHAPDASAPSFLYVGRLAPEKDLETLVRALARLRRRHPGARLVIAGGGPSGAQLQYIAAAEGVADAVIFAGGLAGPALAELFLGATCLILPSSSEPWGLVVNEALHYGCPVIVSDRCGCAPELVDDLAVGQIFRCGDVDELAEKLADAIDRYADRAATAKACLDRIAPFHPTLAARQLCSGLRQIGHKPRRSLLPLGGR